MFIYICCFTFVVGLWLKGLKFSYLCTSLIIAIPFLMLMNLKKIFVTGCALHYSEVSQPLSFLSSSVYNISVSFRLPL